MNNIIKNLKSKCFGKIVYAVTLINVDLEINRLMFDNIKLVDACVEEINNERYWMVLKIEKFRKFDFKYNNEIKHKALFGENDAVTEMCELEQWKYSYPKKDKSLTNIKRIL